MVLLITMNYLAYIPTCTIYYGVYLPPSSSNLTLTLLSLSLTFILVLSQSSRVRNGKVQAMTTRTLFS